MQLFDSAFRKLAGFRVSDYEMSEYANGVKIPTLVDQVHYDPMTKSSDIQSMYLYRKILILELGFIQRISKIIDA